MAKDINTLEAVQRQFTRLIPGFKSLSYEDRLQELGMITIEERHRRLDLIETFKIINGHEGLKSDCFFQEVSEVSHKDTRGSLAKKLTVKQSHLDLRKFSFAHRVVNDWNCLPLDLRESPSVPTFKKHLNNYLN